MKILKIGAVWCPECQIMAPRWDEIHSEMPNLNIESIDLDQSPEAKAEFHVDHVPTFLFFDKSDKELVRLKGLVEKEDLIEVINKYQDK